MGELCLGQGEGGLVAQAYAGMSPSETMLEGGGPNVSPWLAPARRAGAPSALSCTTALLCVAWCWIEKLGHLSALTPKVIPGLRAIVDMVSDPERDAKASQLRERLSPMI